MNDIESELGLYDVRYSAGGASEAGWYLKKQHARTERIEWIMGPGTIDDMVTELRQDLKKRWHGNVDEQVQWWANEKMETARRRHIMTERPTETRATRLNEETDGADDEEPAFVRLSVDENGKLRGHLPVGILTREVRDPEYSSTDPEKTAGSKRSGFLVQCRRAVDLMVEVPVDAPPTNITITCDQRGSVTLHGGGDGDVVHIGPGPGDAVRDGAGTGSARREGGRGSAFRTGSGNGDAERWYRGIGNATRSGDGDGDATRTDQGNGNAVRSGNGRGDAIRDGLGQGDAIVESSTAGSARVGGNVQGNAVRTGTGEGNALVTGQAEGDARVGREAGGTATNRSERPGDAINGSDHKGDAHREGAGSGSAIREGAGRGNANRGGNGDGHAWRADGGKGDAWNTSTGDGHAARSGAGKGHARRQGTHGREWTENRDGAKPAWLEDLADTTSVRTNGEKPNGEGVEDINAPAARRRRRDQAGRPPAAGEWGATRQPPARQLGPARAGR